MSAVARALGIALIALAGLLGGFLAYRKLSTATQPTAPSASALSAAPGTSDAAPTARPIPDVLPALSLPTLAGRNIALSDFRGQPLIINFWATWCAPCRREMPLLNTLQHKFSADRLQIVGIAIDFNAAVSTYLRANPVDYTVLIGEDAGLAAISQFGLEPELPVSIFADAQGRIVATKLGEVHADEADFILGQMHALAAGSITLASAREGITQQLRRLAIERAKSGVPTP